MTIVNLAMVASNVRLKMVFSAKMLLLFVSLFVETVK